MTPMEMLEYIRVPGLPGNPFQELTAKVDKVIAKLRWGQDGGGLVKRIGNNVDRLNKLKYVLMSNSVSEDALKKAAEEIESLMAAIHRDANLLLTL